MAEASIQFLLENLTSLIKEEIGSILGVNAEIQKLSNKLTTIQAVLQDAEDKQLVDKSIRDWLRKINDLSYEIEDVLDEYVYERAMLEHKSRMSKIIKKNVYKWKIARRIKEVTAKLDLVDQDREKFHGLRETTVLLEGKVPASRETGSSLKNQLDHVYGRDAEKEKIVDILVDKVKDRAELSVLPIVGVGGLGKTTFAQLVFNDERIVGHFDVKLWVCVSDDFDPKTLVKAMLESATGSASNLERLDSLESSLEQELNQKRYLLVLDDVWNEDQEKWSMLKGLLTCGSAGSSIIVTTRLKKVADIMSTVQALYLEGLSDESCWLLFKQRAFEAGEEEHTKLEAIGKQIVRKCGGVPLAANALGGIVRFTRKEEEWIHVNESEMWKLPQEESSILPALRLSYQHLPFSLRRCFADCALFPKDSWIKKDELVLHWIAQEYISTDSNGKLNEESIADGIFNELVLRSMFQNVKIDDYDGRVSFQMHDLVHDLAQSIMENRVPGGGGKPEFDDREISNAKIRQVDLLRKCVAFPTSSLPDLDLASVLEKFIRLRILDASYTRIREVPSTIGKLKHVRYLNFSHTAIRTLPDELCSLWNLKVLNLNHCHLLKSLPKKMRRLRNLRHLLLEDCYSLRHMPPRIGELTLLKTLSRYIVRQGENNQLGELQLLNLGGDLRIEHLERVEDPAEAMKAELREKKNLRHLSFEWKRDHSRQSQSVKVMVEKVLEALEPHPNVKKLKIYGFGGENLPNWMGSYSTLENLTSLQLSICPNCSSLPQVLGDLPHLKDLFLNEVAAVEYIIIDDDVVQDFNLRKPKFPSLHKLTLFTLPRLKGLLKGGAGVVFPNLQSLTARGCPLFKLPQLSSITDLSCESKMLPSFYKLHSLTTLWIKFDWSKTPVPKEALQNLINLKSLTIVDGDEHSLPEEGMQALKSLTSLEISSFDTLRCLPEMWLSNLTALESLDLRYQWNLVEIPEGGIKCLHNLTRLDLRFLHSMKCLPNALQHLTSLQTLYLEDLPHLTALPDWLGNLTSLASMTIKECRKLVSFPDSIRNLGKLRRLCIIGCPELWRRCEKDRGEDWHKISHIPYLSGRDDE